MDTLFIDVRVSREDIAYVSHTLESYEGLASVTTIDPGERLIRITTPPFFLEDVKIILRQLTTEVRLELIDEQSG